MEYNEKTHSPKGCMKSAQTCLADYCAASLTAHTRKYQPTSHVIMPRAMRWLMPLMLMLWAITSAHAADVIRINQLGYIPQSSKVAVMLCHEACEVSNFELIDAFTGQAVYASKAVRPTGKLGAFKSTFRLDFSPFTRQGTYIIRTDGCQSDPFPINGQVYRGTADFLLNYMRQQRCGFNPYIKDSCHQKDARIVYNPAREGQHIDVRGGWHDAADLLQYTPTSANAIYLMLTAYQQNPSAFADTHLANGLPGSNGIPDIIDEAYWGLDWLDRMNPSKGELYNQIADDRDHIGMKLPNDDSADYGWGARQDRPVYYVSGLPQQRGKLLNATTGAASTAGKVASCFALGSEILRPFYPEFAKHIGDKAADAYQVGVDKPGNTQTVSVRSPYIYEEDNWTDDMELGAMELYGQTGDRRYLSAAAEYGRREPVTPWMGADSARHYQWYPFMNMGHYRLAGQTADTRLSHEFIRNMRSGILRVLERGRNHPFMWGIPGIWCSNNLTTAMLTQCILYRQLTGSTEFEEMEGSLRDWLFGCNPWGVSMVVELPKGGNYPRQPHSGYVKLHRGTTSGGLVDGPVYSSIFSNLKGVTLTGGPLADTADNYDDCQPGDVVYHDNTNDYSTNEPTMDGTAALTVPLAFYEAEGRKQTAVSSDHNVYEQAGGIIKGDPSKKQICLVFTAADKADGADMIISTLKKSCIKGGFFFTGKFFDLYPDVVRRLTADGHYVGSHSYGHLLYMPWGHRDSMLVTRKQFDDDMLRSYQTLARFGISKDKAPYFIPPYEYYNSTVSSWAHRLGLQVINYTPGTGTNADYTTPDMPNYRSSKTLLKRLLDYEKANTLNGHFLMIHFGTSDLRTDKFYNLLPNIISTLRKRGYKFVSVEEMLGLNMH